MEILFIRRVLITRRTYGSTKNAALIVALVFALTVSGVRSSRPTLNWIVDSADAETIKQGETTRSYWAVDGCAISSPFFLANRW